MLLLLATFPACNRSEPGGLIDVPAGVTTLQPFASHFIGSFCAEPSGLVYNPRNNTLFVVSDSHSEIYEMSLDGKLQKTITTTSTDLEGVGLSITGDTLYIAEERNRKITLYNLTGVKLSSFSADVATLANNGLEGVSAGKGGNIYVLNEKMPGMLLEYLPNGIEVRRVELALASDYSDIMYSPSEDCLWIISDESRKVMKTDLNGALIKQWALTFEKGEGIAIVRDTMYVVNDADAKLYLFIAPK